MPGGMSISGGSGHAQAGNVLETGPIAKCSEAPERGQRGRMQAAGRARDRKILDQTGRERPKKQRQMPPAAPAEHAAETRGRRMCESTTKRIEVRRPGVGSNAGPHFGFGVTLRKFSREQCLRDLPAIR